MREDPQSQAQRQAAAKLALRKQLEKTLLQVRRLSSQCSLVYLTHTIFPVDPTAQAATAGDALHPEPEQHRVRVPARARVRRRLSDQGQKVEPAAAAVPLRPVQDRLHPGLEMGETG